MVGRQSQPTLESPAAGSPTAASNQTNQVSCRVTEADIELCLSPPPPQEEQANGQVVSPYPLQQGDRTGPSNVVHRPLPAQGHRVRRRDDTRPYHLQEPISTDVPPTDQEDHGIKVVGRSYPWLRPVSD